MITREPTPTEHKLIILLALDRLGPVTALQLLRFMVEGELMDYITLQLALAEMDDAGLLRKLPHPLGMLYAPSAQGYETQRLFTERIAPSRVAHIEAMAEAWRSGFRAEKQVLADWQQAPSGEYVVRLKLLEAELALLDVSLSLPTREQANAFCERWPAQAAAIYAQIMHALGEKHEPE